MITQIAAGTASVGTVIDGAGYATAGSSSFPFAGLSGSGSESGTDPRAYLNYISFNRDYLPILNDPSQTGFIRMTTAAKENGTIVSHERLYAQVIVKQAGYIYIYLSNEESSPLEVYFDDFKVEQRKSPVLQMDDYYPFGLTFNPYSRENSVPNKFKFQGQEQIDDLDLNWASFKWRNHQPDIGRFFNVDPLAEKYVYNSPYAFSENKVTSHVELEGLEAENFMSKFKKPSELAVKPVPSGAGVQNQNYSVVVQNGKKGLNDLRSTFKDKPQDVLSNSKADFIPVDGEGKKLEKADLKKGSNIEIDIDGPMSDSFVRVTDTKSDENSFSYTFGTLEGHVEAGQITFSASQDKDGNITFGINSTSKVDYGIAPEGFARDQQQKSWQEVLTNVVNYLQGTEASRTSTVTDQEKKKTN